MLSIYDCNTDEECKQIVQDAIDNGFDVTDNGSIALIHANEYGFLETVKLLIDNGADVTANNNAAVRWASRWGYIDLVQLLIDNGADITANNNKTIKRAINFDYQETVELLEYIRYSQNSFTKSMENHIPEVCEAVSNGTYDSDMIRKTNMVRGSEMVQFLLDNGATLES